MQRANALVRMMIHLTSHGANLSIARNDYGEARWAASASAILGVTAQSLFQRVRIVSHWGH
jgi:hypothetical protein